MRRSCHILFMFAVVVLALGLQAVLFAPASLAQATNPVTNEASPPTPGVGHDYVHLLSETVNPANGSVSLRIQVPVPTGRAISIPFAFTYDTSSVRNIIASPILGYSEWTNGYYPKGGWSDSTPLAFQNQWTTYSQNQANMQTCFYSTNYLFSDVTGAIHSLNVGSMYGWDNNQADMTCPSYPEEYPTGNDTQVFAALTGCLNCGSWSAPLVVADTNGTIYSFGLVGGTQWPTFPGTVPAYIEDRNGNEITSSTSSGTTFTDTLGRPLAISSHSFAGMNYQVVTKTISASFSVPYLQVGSQSGESCSPPPSVSDTQTVVSSITLPNGQQFKFYYGADNPDPSLNNPYGLLSEIDYPDGGWVKYTWSQGNSWAAVTQYTGLIPGGQPVPGGCVYRYTPPTVATRTVGFGGSTSPSLSQMFSYATNLASDQSLWTTKTTSIQTTDNVVGKTSTTNYTYVPVNAVPAPYSTEYASIPIQMPVESQIQYLDWGSTALLKTVTKGWLNQYQMACEFDTLDNGQTSGRFYQYDGLGQVTNLKEYDYGQITSPASVCYTGVPPVPSATPARETVTTFQTFTGPTAVAAGLSFERPSTVKTYGNGALAAETDYGYDETPVSQVSAVQHDEANYGPGFNVRGNVTTKTQKCFVGGTACTNAVTKYTYDETGQVTSMVDACGNTACADMQSGGHTTQYSYTDSYVSGNSNTSGITPPGSTNAYLTTITYPSTGGVAHVEQFSYDYASGQLTVSKDQNSQQTGYQYNDPFARPTAVNYPDGGQTTISYNDAAPTPTVTTQRLQSAGVYVANTATSDGMGHTIQTALTSDPEGADYTDTSYTGTGQVRTVSNPHRSTSSSTDGTTTYAYDALGRVLSVTDQDGSVAQTSYSGACTTVTDEAGKARKSCADGLGRMTDVWEDPNGLNYHTTYAYDGLDNLTAVTQNGSHQRTFSYDSLSRLLSSTNPESNWSPLNQTYVPTTYTYDANGNVATKTAPKPNQQGAATVTTSYQYDGLNRLTQKSFSDGSQTLIYNYDVFSWGSSEPNGIGRLLETQGGNGSNCANDIMSYDVMGRITQVSMSAPDNCNVSGYVTTAAYDLLGDMTSYTNGVASYVFKQDFDNAGRQTAVTSNYVDTTHPANLVAVDPTAGFYPTGAIRKMTYGNGVTEAVSIEPHLQPCHINLNTSGSSINDGCADGSVTGSIQDFDYSFTSPNGGNNGNVTVMNGYGAQSFGRSYSYDGINRLTGMSQTSGSATACSSTYTLSWTYDAWGNRNAQTPVSGTCNSFNQTADSNNRLPAPYAYDTAGNMIQDASHSYTYDAENQLIAVDGGSTAKYAYDAEGRRVEKTVGASNRDYVYNPAGELVTEMCTNCAGYTGWAAGYAYFHGSLAAEYTNSTYFIHSDHLGSTRIVTGMGQTSLSNGGFESGSTGWTTWGGTETVINNSAQAHSGNNYMQLSGAPGGGSYIISQPIAVQPGDHIVFGGWVNTQYGSNGTPGWWLEVNDANHSAINWIGSNNGTPAPGWSYQEGSYTVPASGVSYVEVYAEVYLPSQPITLNVDDGFVYDNGSAGYTLADNMDYLPFGEQILGGSDTTHKFTGKERDNESGLDYFGARYDSSSMGRFMTPDWSAKPQGVPYAQLTDPQSLNLYSYVRNNPLSRIDADGHCAQGAAICQAWTGAYNWVTSSHSASASASATAAQGGAGSGPLSVNAKLGTAQAGASASWGSNTSASAGASASASEATIKVTDHSTTQVNSLTANASASAGANVGGKDGWGLKVSGGANADVLSASETGKVKIGSLTITGTATGNVGIGANASGSIGPGVGVSGSAGITFGYGGALSLSITWGGVEASGGASVTGTMDKTTTKIDMPEVH